MLGSNGTICDCFSKKNICLIPVPIANKTITMWLLITHDQKLTKGTFLLGAIQIHDNVYLSDICSCIYVYLSQCQMQSSQQFMGF